MLAIALSVAIPRADVISPAVADAAATEVAQALRFARGEAMRTRAWHVVRFDTAGDTLRVYRLTSGIAAEDTAQPVMHPIDHRPYRVVLGATASSHARIVSAIFDYDKNLITAYATFGPDGSPADIHGKQAKDAKALRKDGLVTLRHGAVERSVRLAPVTGRVST
ncbi:hypothetical protein IM543_00970 [Massilia sp. UMI-21]|nr:hypothetical protein IM543_00970 [Massilia sp. UMI-21]